MNITKIFLGLSIILWSLNLQAQKTTIFTDADLLFKSGMEHFDKGLFGMAMNDFSTFIDMIKPLNDPQSDLLIQKAELFYAKSAVRKDLPNGENLMLEFIRKYQPDPISNQALIELADFYFKARKYDKAIEYYKLIPVHQLSSRDKAEVKFKMGYAFFIQKEFPQAKANFFPIKQLVKTDYYYPANYYYGLCEFFEGRYQDAVNSFRVVENSPKYNKYIPYYLAQIYFAQGEFDKLIEYATPRLNQSNVKNKPGIHQLIGQAYFERGEFEEALPHLEMYASKSRKLRPEEFYQLGITQHKMGKYKEAAQNLQELSSLKSKIGQHGVFVLGDCQIRINEKHSARTAFGTAARMIFDPKITEDATFQYAKLSYELKFDEEALTALQTISPGSTYYRDAQELMGEIFMNSRNYQKSIALIEKMPNKTPKIREAYQKVTYYGALQVLQDGDRTKAKVLLLKSMEEPVDQKYKALATYWMGDLMYHDKKYDSSIRYLNQFMSLSKSLRNLPDESSMHTANYTLGYCYLKQKKYGTAQGYFQECVAGIKRNSAMIKNDFVRKNILGDAILRAGDTYFKKNKYDKAIRFYDEAIANKFSGFEYAIYQKAIIEGLRNKRTEQILAFEQLIEQYPNSEFTDDALLQLGIVYQEINRLTEAMVPLKKLISDYKNKSNLVNKALLRLGLISYNLGNTTVAINYYKRIFGQNPTPAEASEALKGLEEIYVRDLGTPEEYVALLETLPGYSIDSATKDSINFNAAENQYEAGNYARAVTAFTSYINKFPQGRYRLLAQYHRAESHMIQKQYSEALRDFEYVIGRGISDYYKKSIEKAALIAYNHEKDFSKAYNYYQLWIENANSDQDRFEAVLGAMRSAYRANNTNAVYALAQEVAGHQNATKEQKATAHFYIAKIAYDRKDYETALNSLNQSLRNNKTNEQAAEARYLIAYIYYLERELNTALDICTNASQESAGYPYWVAKSVLLMADIHAEKGDLYNARGILEALINNYDGDADLIQEAKAKKAQIERQLEAQSRLDSGNDDGTLELDESN